MTRRRLTPHEIIDITCRLCGVDRADLITRSHVDATVAKRVISKLMREETTMSYPEICAQIGCGNHSTIITAHQQADHSQICGIIAEHVRVIALEDSQ